MQTVGLVFAVLSAFFLSLFALDAPIGLRMLAIVKDTAGIDALQAWFLIVLGLPSGLAIGIALVVFSLRIGQ